MRKLLDVPGEPVSLHDLTVPRARDTGRVIAAEELPYAKLIECWSSEGSEGVVVELEVELSQHQVYAIQRFEPLAIEFYRSDDRAPEVLSLREDFPVVPHLNLRPQELPRSLCLYEEPWYHVRRRWTPARFIEWLREWLRLTARGELHGRDQPLEPLFLAAAGRLIIPYQLLSSRGSEDAEPLRVRRVASTGQEFVAIVGRLTPGSEDATPHLVATSFQCAPQTHGLIRAKPTDLGELHRFIEPTGSDLIGTLRERLRTWVDADRKLLDAHLILIVNFPKKREPAGPVEAPEVWAFFCKDLVRSIGVKLGLWTMQGETLARLIPEDLSRDGAGASLELLRPTSSLSRDLAAYLNGEERSDPTNITAVGAGALGSQVTHNLLRSGFGRWTIIDSDILLPHNLARHGLDGRFVGHAKGAAMEIVGNALTDGEPPVSAIVADVLSPGEQQEVVSESLAAAEVVLDLSASVAVARHLALDVKSDARRVSLFLNPSGTDLVLLAEDAQRTVWLDALELQFYRALITNPDLAGHFGPPGERLRYGLSCRDLTSRIPQHLVGLHAAIASRALRSVLASDAATISLWRADPETMCVQRFDLMPTQTHRSVDGRWTVCIDEGLSGKLHAQRRRRLPNETGGVLIGSFDLDRSIIYAVDMLSSPPDSEEWPTLYIRGRKGLKSRVKQIGNSTDGQLEYIGEWHSHPTGSTCRPSGDDLQVFSWLTDLMKPEGLPPVMMIAGDGGELATFVSTIAGDHEDQ